MTIQDSIFVQSWTFSAKLSKHKNAFLRIIDTQELITLGEVGVITELEEVNALRQKYGWEEVGVGHELVQKKKKARKIMEDMQESQLVNSRKEGDEKSGKKGAKTAKDKADKKPASSSSDNATKSDKRSGGDKEDKAKRAKTLFFFML